MTEISFSIPTRQRVRLTVLDIYGRLVSELTDEEIPGGSHTLRFDGSRLPSGTYFYRLISGNTSLTRKMCLVK